MHHPLIAGSTILVTKQGIEMVAFSDDTLHWWASVGRRHDAVAWWRKDWIRWSGLILT